MKTTANKIYPFFFLILLLMFAFSANSQVYEPFQKEKSFEVQKPIGEPPRAQQGPLKAGPTPPGGGNGDEGGGWVGSDPTDDAPNQDAYSFLLGIAMFYASYMLIRRRKKLKAFITLTAIVFVLNTQAQVRIGNDEEPVQGAILDLSSGTTSDGYVGGLVLPNVEITDLDIIPSGAEGFSDGGSLTSGEKIALTGMIVYNTTTSVDGSIVEGIYLWKQDKWHLLAYDCCGMSLKVQPGIFSAAGGTTNVEVLNTLCQDVTSSYDYLVFYGSAYASVSPATSGDGKFTLSISSNSTGSERGIVVFVSDACGTTTAFRFTQAAH